MTPSEKSTPREHFKDLLPVYLEGELAATDREAVESHLEKCLECFEELSALKQVVNVLKTDKSVFCPEPWELYEFIENGESPGGKIAQHLEQCPLCSTEVAEYRQTAIQKTLPEEIENELKKVFPKPPQSGITTEIKNFGWTKDWLSSIFRMPVLALGTAIAAILAVILLYPYGSIPTFIGVSSENWEEAIPQVNAKSLFPETSTRKEIAEPAPLIGHGASKPMLFEVAKPRVAPVIVFHGFDKPLPQSTVDSLYEQLRPSADLEKRFQFSTPAQLKQFLDKVKERHFSPSEALSAFYKEAKLNFALLENVKAEKYKFGLKSQLIDTHNGKILAESIESGLSGTELASKVSDSLDLLNNVKTENRAK